MNFDTHGETNCAHNCQLEALRRTVDRTATDLEGTRSQVSQLKKEIVDKKLKLAIFVKKRAGKHHTIGKIFVLSFLQIGHVQSCARTASRKIETGDGFEIVGGGARHANGPVAQ